MDKISSTNATTDIDYARLIQRGRRLRSQAVLSALRRLQAVLTRHRDDPQARHEAATGKSAP